MLRLAYRSPVRLVSAARLQTRRCTPLTLSKYSTTQHHKTPRNGRPFNESSERASGDSDSSGDIGRRGVGTYLSGALFLLSADALYTLWSEKQRDGNLDAAFTPHAIPDVPGFVARPDLTQKIRNIFRRRTGMYDVVVGNRGSGKSAILEKLAAETEGALYVCIADCEDVNRALTKALRKALGGELRPTLLVGTLWQKSLDSGSDDFALQSALDEFERAAALFKDKHNRAAVLVIDNIDVIARKKPRLLGSIQNMAKFAADNELYKVVFVCTSEATYHKLKEDGSAWSRAKEFRLGDLTTAEAMQYLTEKRKLDPACAAKILQYCGTRIQLLQDVSSAVASGIKLEDYVASLRERAWNGFTAKAEKVDKTLAISVAQRLIEHGPLGYQEFKDACGRNRTGYKFLTNDVFAMHSDDSCGFEDKVTEDAVRMRLVQSS